MLGSGIITRPYAPTLYVLRADIPPDWRSRISMKGMILAAFVALGMTAGIAWVGVASLDNGVAVLINASSHSDPYDNTTNSHGGRYVGRANGSSVQTAQEAG
jgi:hypothetical protein